MPARLTALSGPAHGWGGVDAVPLRFFTLVAVLIPKNSPMPAQNLAKMHMTPAELAQADSLINQLQALYAPYLRNLSPEENKKYGRINEKNKLFVNKVMDYHQTQPALQSNDVDWPEFERDFAQRKHYETSVLRLGGLAKAMTETCRLHDHDNFVNAQIDYEYAQYKNRLDIGLGYDSKVETLQQFFKKRGKSSLDDGTSPI
jgi:hypothetical protein